MKTSQLGMDHLCLDIEAAHAILVTRDTCSLQLSWGQGSSLVFCGDMWTAGAQPKPMLMATGTSSPDPKCLQLPRGGNSNSSVNEGSLRDTLATWLCPVLSRKDASSGHPQEAHPQP